MGNQLQNSPGLELGHWFLDHCPETDLPPLSILASVATSLTFSSVFSSNCFIESSPHFDSFAKFDGLQSTWHKSCFPNFHSNFVAKSSIWVKNLECRIPLSAPTASWDLILKF